MEDKIKYKIVFKKTRRDIEELDKSLDEGTEEGKIKIIGERVKVSLEVLLEISCVIDLTEQENTEYEELDKKGRVSIRRVEQIEKGKKQKNLQKLISPAMRRLERVVCRAEDNLKVTKNKVMINNLKVDKRDLLESMESLEKDMISLQEIDNRDQLNNDWETLKDKTELILDEIDYSLTVHDLDTFNDTPASNMQSQMNASTHSVSSPLCYPPVYSSFQGPSGEHRATVEALPDYFPDNTGSPSALQSIFLLHPVSSHPVSSFHSLPRAHNVSSHISMSPSFTAQHDNQDYVFSPACTVTSQHFIPPIFPTQHNNVSSYISMPQSLPAQHVIPSYVASPACTVTSQQSISPSFHAQQNVNVSSHISVPPSFPVQHAIPGYVYSPAHTIASQHSIPQPFPSQHYVNNYSHPTFVPTPMQTKRPSLPIFSGERQVWPEFKALWKALAEPQFTSPLQLAKELKEACKGKAAERIKNIYLTSEAAYGEMWRRLTEEYDDPGLSVQSALKKLRMLKPVADKDYSGIV